MANTVPYWNPEAGALLQATPANAKRLADSGYKIGKDAERESQASFTGSSGVAALLGAANGLTLGGADWALNKLPAGARDYVHALEEVHPYARGLGEVVGSVGSMVATGGATAAVGLGARSAMAARVAASAVAGGMGAVNAAQARDNPDAWEQFAAGAGIGGAMGAFGEGAGALIGKATPSFQRFYNNQLKRAARVMGYEQKLVKVPPVSPAAPIAPAAPFTPSTPNAPTPASFVPKPEEVNYIGTKPVAEVGVPPIVGSLPETPPPIKVRDVTRGEGYSNTAALSDEEINARASYFRSIDPKLTAKRLANKLASTNDIPFEELWVHAQPEFKWARAGEEGYNVDASRDAFLKTPQGQAWRIGKKLEDVPNTAASSADSTTIESGLRDNVTIPSVSGDPITDDMMSRTYGKFLSTESREALQKYQEEMALYSAARKTYNKNSRAFQKELSEWSQKGGNSQSPRAPVVPAKPVKPTLDLPYDAGVSEQDKVGLANLGFKVKVAPSPDKFQTKWTRQSSNPLRTVARSAFGVGGLSSGAAFIGVPYASGVAALGYTVGGGLYGADRLVQSALHGQAFTDRMFEQSIAPVVQKIGKAVRLFIESAVPPTSSVFFGSEDVDQSYNAVSNSLSQMSSNPSAVADHLRETYKPALGDNEEAHAAIIGIQANAINYLVQQMPKDPRQPSLLQSEYMPTRSDKVKFLHKVNAVNDPIGALADPTIESMKAVAAVYPNTLQSVKKMVMSALLENPDAKLSPNQAKRVSMLMGIPANAGMQPAYIARIQQYARAGAVQQSPLTPQRRGRGRPPKVTVKSAGAKSLAAPSQQNEIENV